MDHSTIEQNKTSDAVSVESDVELHNTQNKNIVNNQFLEQSHTYESGSSELDVPSGVAFNSDDLDVPSGVAFNSDDLDVPSGVAFNSGDLDVPSGVK
jgi:hypothetical protein